MNRSAVAGSTLATLVLSASLLRIAAPSSQPSSVTPAATTQAPSASPPVANDQLEDDRLGPDGPWRASQRHFAGMFAGSKCDEGPEGGASLQGKTKAATHSASQNQPWCIPNGQHVDALIAIVPDPVNSHLALFFDRSIEAI